jgi:uncharacterized iron-regulated membrane protein
MNVVVLLVVFVAVMCGGIYGLVLWLDARFRRSQSVSLTWREEHIRERRDDA